MSNNPPDSFPFRSEQSVRIKTKKFATPTLQSFAWGNGKGISRIDILSPFKTPLIKAREGLSESIAYFAPQRVAYIAKKENYQKIFSLLQLDMPFTLDDFFAIITGNASRVYSRYYTSITTEDGIIFILTKGSELNIKSLFISYDNKRISWKDSTGWQINFIVENGKIVGLLAEHEKGYTFSSKLTKLEHNYPVKEENLILRMPQNVNIRYLE